MSSKFTDYSIDPTGYAAFDATTLKSLIIERLKQQNIFTDQVFEGSNLSSIIDIVAYSYHTLMFYLNRTATETMFTDAQLYENMNRIVKLLNYKPIGFQTSVVTFDMVATSDLDIGTYILPRYSKIDADGIPYTLLEDIIFTKPTNNQVNLSDSTGQFNLHQGEVTEYPQYIASGNKSETIVLSLDPTQVQIDHFSIHVYVRSADGLHQYTEVDSLYTQEPRALCYEHRLNENYRHEIRFGDDINGRSLQAGDTVYVYYAKSLGDSGTIPISALNDKTFTLHTTPQFNTIKDLIYSADDQLLNFSTIEQITISNKTGSTIPRGPETVDEIRDRSPVYFSGQNRLITADDFTTHIKRHFGNIVNDVVSVNNRSYLNGHIKYLHEEIGISNPTLESRVLFNQSKFSGSTNFNNVYLYVVPRVSRKSSINIQTNFVASSQKEAIKLSLEENKSIGLNVTFADPVYMAVDFGVGNDIDSNTSEDCQMIVYKTSTTATSDSKIKSSINSIILEYFKLQNCKLGQLIDVDSIESSILSVDGVQSIEILNTVTNERSTGLSMLVWNPVYDTQDIKIYNQNIQLPYYKFPYFYDELSILNRITVTKV
ncbi:hypothetical protein N9033_00650 [bacterium]|nr:hypothetical protein [bacterium]